MHDAGMTGHVLREVGELPRLQSIRSLSGPQWDSTPSVELQQQYSGNSVTKADAKFTVLQISLAGKGYSLSPCQPILE